MLRRHIPLLMLSLFAAFALVTPRAEAANITLLDGGDNIFCTDAGGAGTTCSKSIVLGSVDLTDGAVNLNFELQATVPQGTWNVMVTATDGESSDTHSFAPIAPDGI